MQGMSSILLLFCNEFYNLNNAEIRYYFLNIFIIVIILYKLLL